MQFFSFASEVSGSDDSLPLEYIKWTLTGGQPERVQRMKKCRPRWCYCKKLKASWGKIGKINSRLSRRNESILKVGVDEIRSTTRRDRLGNEAP
jgi:hypothetical protein